VDVAMLDKLMNLVGVLVLSRNQILQYTVRHDDAALGASSQHLNLITTELQEGVMKTRMQPIGTVWNKLLRNACDHGLETPAVRTAAGKPAQGTLSMRAFHEGGHVNIEIADDGAGIDPQKVKNKALDKGLDL
jgi:two-component system chemotaxis sensor kinase CheA